MKKLINRPDRIIPEMLDGFLALNPGFSRLSNHDVVIRSDIGRVKEEQISVISGGGSGHEPAHAGFIGAGMLSAAVAGEIFTSPSVDSVLAAIRAVAGRPGVLLIVKNYTGDRLNFGLAAEMARAEGILVETVLVADDVALAATERNAGRRGIAGTVLVHKIAGAAASEGKDLPQVASLAQAAAESIGTMGVSLSAGVSPATGKASFVLGDEVELGLGIHGEPGVRRIPMLPSDELVNQLLNNIVPSLQLRAGERVVLLVNNLGSTTNMELAIVGKHALAVLEENGIVVERALSGTFMSSLDMAGVSLSLMRVDDERLKLFDASTSAPAWPRTIALAPGLITERIIPSGTDESPALVQAPETPHGRQMSRAVAAGCHAILNAAAKLTEMDQLVGDGDMGINMARAAAAILQTIAEYPFDRPAEALKALGFMTQKVLGGSSGPLYGAFLLRAGTALESGEMNGAAWASALLEGCDAIGTLGGASLGDRTMLDALLPFVQTLQTKLATGSSLELAVASAVEAGAAGAELTAQMTARRGRSSYLGERALGTVDPGAAAVMVLVRATVPEVVSAS